MSSLEGEDTGDDIRDDTGLSLPRMLTGRGGRPGGQGRALAQEPGLWYPHTHLGL